MERFFKFSTLVVLLFFLLGIACGGKDSESPEDLAYKNLLGRWIATAMSQENGVKVVETLILICWEQSDYLGYRWSYTATRDGVKDESKTYEEQGTFTATETEITFIAEGKDPKILNYIFLTTDPLYDLIIIDENGVEWKFEYFYSDYTPGGT